MLSPESLTGEHIDHFRLDQFIARGAVSTVYRASDTMSNRTVALKIIPRKTDLTPEMERVRMRLAQEVIPEGRPAHPNILAIYSYGETDELEYICMEYVRGRTLADILAEKKVMEIEEAAPILEQVLLALESANQTRIVHGDIKPSNIMIREDGRVKVMSFGIAKLPSIAVTTTGAVDEPQYYRSPEQVSGQKVDIRSDLFSVGAVLFETLTGVKPFEGESASAIADRIVNAQPALLRALNDRISEPVEAVCGRALSKDPSKRYQTPWEMLKRLRSATSDPTVMEHPPAGVAQTSVVMAAKEPKAKEAVGTKQGPTAPDSASSRGTTPESKPLPGTSAQVPREGAALEPIPKRSGKALGITLLLLIVAGLASALYFLPTGIPESITSFLGITDRAPQSGVASQPSQYQPTESVASLLAQAQSIWGSDASAARRLIERARTLDPYNLDPLMLFARLLAVSGDFAAAAEQYRSALLINNQAAEAFCGLGHCYFSLDNFDLAVENYEACLVLSPARRAEITTYLGISYFKKNDPGRARALLGQALELNPGNDVARSYLAIIPQASESGSGAVQAVTPGAPLTPGMSGQNPDDDASQPGLPQPTTPGGTTAGPPRAEAIRVGMTYQQVREALGAPRKIERGDRLIEWEYDIPTGRIEVKFKKGRAHSIRVRKGHVRD